MSSINPHFTFQYSQPEEYKFSHDSVFLARHVFDRIQDRLLSTAHILDLCAGCGIVGLDLLFHLQTIQNAPASIDFVEIQEVYREHFLKNKNQLPATSELNFICANYNSLLEQQFSKKYDVIVGNPPYFMPHQGKLSPSEFKNRCRFFLDATFSELMIVVAQKLKPQGVAFILVRPLKDHGIDLIQLLPASLAIVDTQSIRGTDVLQLKLAE